MRRGNFGNQWQSGEAERLWLQEQEYLKRGQNWLRVKAFSLDQFHVIKQLGRGMYGPVRLVKHKTTGNLYAMKAYHHTSTVEDQQMIQRLNNERTLLMEVQSVWVPRMFHSVQDSSFHFVLLEHVPGGSLSEVMREEGNLQEVQARFYGAEMLMAINVLHRYGFMHRNIQPSNFLIDQFGHLKITDFGGSFRFLPAETCAKMASEASIKEGKPYVSGERRDRVQIYQRKTTENKVGTVEFMAPEVVRKRPKGLLSYIRPADPTTMYSFAADFWSFGVCMYNLLFGEMPFTGNSRKDVVSKIISWRKALSFPMVQPISDEAKDLIKKLICDEPYRLGLYGCEDVMSHVFFDSVDWLRLRDWPVPVPFRPEAEENSDSSIAPPAFLARFFQGQNRASNNDRPPVSNQPYLEDPLSIRLGPGTSAHSDSSRQNKILQKRDSLNALPATVPPSPHAPSTSFLGEPSERALRGSDCTLPSVSTPYMSPQTSAPTMDVSWDDKAPQGSHRQDILMWLQQSPFGSRPSGIDSDLLLPAGTRSAKDLQGTSRMSEDKEKAERGKDGGNLGEKSSG